MRELLTKVTTKCKCMYATLMCALFMGMTMGLNFCTVTVKGNVSTEAVLGGVIGVIIQIAKYVGIALSAGGIFMLIIAYKDDNADAQSRAIRLVVVGVALLGLKELLRISGLIA